jgi:hypothetical protein
MDDRFEFPNVVRQFVLPQRRRGGDGFSPCVRQEGAQQPTLWELAWPEALGNLKVSIADARRRYLDGHAQEPYRASKCWRVVGPRYPERPERETVELCLKVFGRVVPSVFGPGVDKITFSGQPRAVYEALKAMRTQVSTMTHKDQNSISQAIWGTVYRRKLMTKLNKHWDYDEETDRLIPKS